MLAWFIANGVDLGRHGGAALHHAAASGRPDLVRLLLELERAGRMSATTLERRRCTMPPRTGQIEVVRLLLARGAERNPRDRDGRGVDAYHGDGCRTHQALIKRRGMSRAYKPTEHLKMQLADLTAQHAAIRELLAQ